jgi:hypothetical protein
MTASASLQIQICSIDRLVFYARNPRETDAAVDRPADHPTPSGAT